MRDTTELWAMVHAAEATGVIQATQQQKTQAVLVTCDRTGTATDALLPLAALGLIDPYQPLPGQPDTNDSTVKRVAAATHGTRAGVAWHKANRVAMCSPCRAWGSTNQRGEH